MLDRMSIRTLSQVWNLNPDFKLVLVDSGSGIGIHEWINILLNKPLLSLGNVPLKCEPCKNIHILWNNVIWIYDPTKVSKSKSNGGDKVGAIAII